MDLVYILLQAELGDVEPVLSLIERYGILSIAVVVLALFTLFLVKWVLKKSAAETQRYVDMTNKLVEVLENKKDNKDEISNEVIDKHAKINDKIQRLLYNILNQIDGDRVMIYEYHNGGKTISGVNFIKCTCTYDVTDLGIPSKKFEHANMPISTHYLWNKILLQKGPILCPNTQLEDDAYVAQIFKTEGVKSYYSFLLLDYDTKPVGFMTVEFLNNIKRLDEEDMNFLNNQALTISGLVRYDK